MRKITDSNALFDVEINPFLREIKVKHIKTGVSHTYNYETLEELFSFEGMYDIMFTYEEDGLNIQIDEVDNESTENLLPYNLDINGI